MLLEMCLGFGLFSLGFAAGYICRRKCLGIPETAETAHVAVEAANATGPLYGVFRVRVGGTVFYMVLPWHGWKLVSDPPSWKPELLYGQYHDHILERLGHHASDFKWWEFRRHVDVGSKGETPPMEYDRAVTLSLQLQGTQRCPVVIVDRIEPAEHDQVFQMA